MSRHRFLRPAPDRSLICAALALLLCTAAWGDVIELPDGSRYTGPTVQGKLQGKGKLQWRNGDVYEGDFVSGLRQGKGRLRTGSSSVYQGEFRDGRKHGHGRLEWGTGWLFEGEFADGQMRKGRLVVPKQYEYVGELQDDLLHGQGRLKMEDGLQFEGQFKDNEPAGPGRMTLPNGVVLEGLFNGMEPPDRGVLKTPDGGRYEGELHHGMPNGSGRFTYADKTVVLGQFSFGTADGPGRIIYPDGSRYQGELSGNLPDGQGRLKRPDGTEMKGQWRAGRFMDAKGGNAAADGGTRPDTPEQAAANNQTVLYNQPALLQAQFDRLQASAASTPQMYALYVAGDGRQEVFRREIESVAQHMHQRFGTQDRSVLLVNSRSSVDRLPLATEHSIGQALQALAGKMNRDRDYLFVYLSSHGSREHDLSIAQSDMRLPSLSAKRLGELLKSSGIRKQIVVVSACYSGGFIPALKGDNTWVITASRADRTSFGCADGNDYTYFGRALFANAIPTAATLSQAFDKASELVRDWETNGNAPGETPQEADDDTDSAPSPWAILQQQDKGPSAAGGQHAAATPATASSAAASAPGKVGTRRRSAMPNSTPQSAVTPAFRKEVDQWVSQHRPGGA